MPQVYTNGVAKHIRGLGWLQHHLDQVVKIEVIAYVQPTTKQGIMTAYLDDGRTFKCEWASLKVCAAWLARPSLTNVLCFWINHTTTCGALKHYHF